MDDDSRLARAEAMGFDTSTVWYHGTKARNFSRFRVGKDGIDELGSGVYFCSNRQYAEPWARGGRMLECFLRKGDFFDLSRLKKDKQGPGHTRDRAMAELHPRHTAMMNKLWGGDNGYDFDTFKQMIDQNNKHHLAELLHKLGYMGAVDPTSQIPTQCVVFDPKDVRLTTAKFDPAKSETGTIRD